MRHLLLAATMLLWGPGWESQLADRPTYSAVVAGMRCKQQTSASVTQMDCEYHAGRSLEFVMAGVGQKDTAITVVRSNGYDADYYASIGVAHGCVIVKPGKLSREAALRRGIDADMAFVSPKTGKVYTTWQECDHE